MNTRYKHRVTMICHESLMDAANQLALIAGESPHDVNTFKVANYTDSLDNKYSVCSTVVTDGFFDVQNGIQSELPQHAINADTALAQQALDSLVTWQDGMTLQSDALTMFIDINPMDAISYAELKK